MRNNQLKCVVEDCEKKRFSGMLCAMHNYRYKNGIPLDIVTRYTIRKPVVHGDMAMVQLSSNGKKYAIFDVDDIGIISKMNWHLDGRGYAFAHYKCKTIKMHRLLLNAKSGDVVDHINGDKLDNRRINIRIVTSAQNAWNTQTNSKSKSGYIGVIENKGRGKRWIAAITVNNKRKYLGRYDTPEEAARVYNEASTLYRGKSYNKLINTL